jgi:hypothetical protein
MSFRPTGLAVLISLLIVGCASQQYLRACGAPSLERQQQGLREAGRIGYIGNEGPALGTSLP